MNKLQVAIRCVNMRVYASCNGRSNDNAMIFTETMQSYLQTLKCRKQCLIKSGRTKKMFQRVYILLDKSFLVNNNLTTAHTKQNNQTFLQTQESIVETKTGVILQFARNVYICFCFGYLKRNLNKKLYQKSYLQLEFLPEVFSHKNVIQRTRSKRRKNNIFVSTVLHRSKLYTVLVYIQVAEIFNMHKKSS